MFKQLQPFYSPLLQFLLEMKITHFIITIFHWNLEAVLNSNEKKKTKMLRCVS